MWIACDSAVVSRFYYTLAFGWFLGALPLPPNCPLILLINSPHYCTSRSHSFSVYVFFLSFRKENL
jgi:hypothetical protein